ncbi:TroA family protein [Arthrobacter pigmenti]
MTSLSALLTAAVAVVGLTACGSESGGSADDGTLTVVTSTSAYGSIVEAVAGDNVEVTSIIDSVNQDPHSYEATVRDKLEVSKADLVIENGGGYDSFLHQLVEDTGIAPGRVLTAVEFAGEGYQEHNGGHQEHRDEHGDSGHHGHDHGSGNEHVWYDLSAMSGLSQRMAAKLAEMDPGNRGEYQANAAGFAAGLGQLQEQLGHIEQAHRGEAVAITEPVPVHLLENAGLENKTPPEFSQAIEEGHGVSPAVLQEMLQLLSKDHQVQFLAYNAQTAGNQTEAVKQAAREAGVPVVSFTETLPGSSDYVKWMGTNVDNIEQALNEPAD